MTAKTLLDKFTSIDEVTGIAAIRVTAVTKEGEVFHDDWLIPLECLSLKQAVAVSRGINTVLGEARDVKHVTLRKDMTDEELASKMHDVGIPEDKAATIIKDLREGKIT